MAFKTKKALSEKEVTHLMMEDLKRSGLNGKHVSKYHLEPIQRYLTHGPGYKIPYPGTQGYYRVKLLQPRDKRKYMQPPHTAPRAFIPSEDCVNQSELYITEGEKKALCAYEHGYPAIGLGGVWSFKSKKLNLSFLPELEEIVRKKEVYLVFDNDITEKPEVQAALHTLAQEILRRDGTPSIIQLPPGPLKGWDDFLVAEGKEKFEELGDEEISPDAATMFNEKAAYVKKIQKVFDLDIKRAINNPDLHFANIVKYDDNGKPVPAFKIWSRMQNRRTYDDLTYLPSGPEVTDANEYNLWEDDGVTPEEGDVTLFLEWIESRIASEEERNHLLDLIAFKLQHRDIKIRQHVVLYSRQHQVGKNTLTDSIVLPLFGKSNVGKATQHNLESEYNGWAGGKEIIIADEVTVSRYEKRRIGNQLKDILTASTIVVNEKYQPQVSMPNYSTFFFTSNTWPPVFIEPHDTRYFCIHFEEKRLETSEINKFFSWLDKGGIAHIRHYLETRDVSHFQPFAASPTTALKLDLIKENADPLEEWVINGVLENRTENAKGLKIHYSGSELVDLYRYHTNDQKTSDHRIKVLLSTLGGWKSKKFAFGKSGETKTQIYCISRNEDDLRIFDRMKSPQIKKILDKHN